MDISGLPIWESGGRCSEAWNGRTTIRPSVMKFVILLLAIKESYFRNQQKRPGFGQIPAQFENKCSKIASFRHITDCAASPPKTNEGHTPHGGPRSARASRATPARARAGGIAPGRARWPTRGSPSASPGFGCSQGRRLLGEN